MLYFSWQLVMLVVIGGCNVKTRTIRLDRTLPLGLVLLTVAGCDLPSPSLSKHEARRRSGPILLSPSVGIESASFLVWGLLIVSTVSPKQSCMYKWRWRTMGKQHADHCSSERTTRRQETEMAEMETSIVGKCV